MTQNTQKTQAQDIAERVNSYEDACAIKGMEPLTIEHVSCFPEDQRQAILSLHRIITVIEVINEGHVFDYNNFDEEKYFPVWDMETYGDAPAGSGFAFLGYVFDCDFTFVGARLSTRTAAHAKQVATIMEADYKNFMVKTACQ